MATTAVDPVFVDTNVLVFANVRTAPHHAEARQALQDLAAAGAPLWVSRQVLREYLAALSRPQPFTAALSPAQLLADMTALQSQFHVAEDSAAVLTNLLALMQSIAFGGKQVHDANIVATMQAYGITRLLTNNVADFTRFSSVITVIPLVP